MIFSQTKHNKDKNEEERNLLIFLLCSLLNESDGKLEIKNLVDDSLEDFGIEVDISNLSPDRPLEIKLVNQENVD